MLITPSEQAVLDRCRVLCERSAALRAECRRLAASGPMLAVACRALGAVIKACGCGRRYRYSGWKELQLVGIQRMEGVEGEMRNCPCRSTLMVVTRRGPAPARV